ncbi:MAG: diguanylate cyclase [Thermoanaerobaculaceae bacterium]|nr:diguanylate cyclase [Thermoanaerobaculaceae bacterium]
MDWDLDELVADLPAVFFRGYADGSIDLFDRKVEEMTGYAKEEFESRSMKWTDLILPADRDGAKRALVAALADSNAYTREYRITPKAGNVVWVHERSRIVCGADGAIQCINGLFFDVTDRKNLERSLQTAERDLRLVIDNVPAVMFKGSLDGSVEFFDTKVEAIVGHRAGSFGRRGLRWTDLIVEEDRHTVRQAFIHALKTNKAYVREYRVRSAHGAPVWIHERSHIVCDDAGRPESVSGLFFDVTDRKELEAAVAQRTAELQQANAHLALWAGELEHRNTEINLLGQLGDLLQSCNTSAEALAGIERFLPKFFPGDSGALYVFGESSLTLEAAAVWGPRRPEQRVFSVDECWGMRRGRAHGREEILSGFRCRHVGAGDRPYVCVPMTAHGSALGVLHVLLEPLASEQWDARQQLGVRVAEHLALALAKLKLQETLQHLSVRDPLTGLYNRRYLEEALAREMRRAERHGTQLGLIMIDIDHFKRFNDTLGHDAGDALLRELGALLQRQVRTGDVACRYGGEEFMVVLQDVPPDLPRQRAERIREAAKEIRVRHGERVLDAVTLSLGVALFPEHGGSPDLLMRSADVALYRAKQEGRDRACVAQAPPSARPPEATPPR